MYELIVTSIDPIGTTARNVPIPTPGALEVCIQLATTSNPKDWQNAVGPPPRCINEGDDIAGIIHSVGPGVLEYRSGDRVAAFHKMGAAHGSYAEYAIAPESTTFHLPDHTSFEEGATIPLTSMTAAIALFQHLMLPLPWQTFHNGSQTPYGPLMIYGGASTVGAYALKFAGLVKKDKTMGVGPIITVAGTDSIEFIKSLDAADNIIDYRKQDVVTEVRKILHKEGKHLRHAFDAISHTSARTWESIVPCLAESGHAYLNMVDPPEVDVKWPTNMIFSRTLVSGAYGEEDSAFRNRRDSEKDGDFAYAMYRYISRMLRDGRFTGHPYEIMKNGLADVATGLQMLREGKVHGKKLVYRVQDTPGLEAFNN